MIKHRPYRILLKNIVIQLVISLLCYFSALLFIPEALQPEETDPSIPLYGSGVAIMDEKLPSLLRQELIEKEHKIKYYEFADTDVLSIIGQEYYIKDPNSKKEAVRILPDYPLIFDNGAYLYLYHGGFQLVNEELVELEAEEGSCLREGRVYNRDRLSEESGEVILLKLPNGLYINTQRLWIEQSTSLVEIEKNCVLSFGENIIAYGRLMEEQQGLKLEVIEDPMDIVRVGSNRMSYDSFLERLNPGTGEIEAAFELIMEEPLYQYFLGNRYDYTGTKKLFWSRKGYFCEQEERKFYLPCTPVYYSEDKRLLLPCDYELIQPKLFQIHKLPALTQITAGEGTVYTSWRDIRKTYSDVIAYDGEDTYLFFNDTELTWGDESYQLSPFSYVVTGEDGSIGLYNYDTAEYLQFITEGSNQVKACVAGEFTVNLSDDILYRPDEQEQLLFSDPSLLPIDR